MRNRYRRTHDAVIGEVHVSKRLPRKRNAVCSLILTVWFACVVDAREPFVVGFERFARHGDMTEIDSGTLLFNELNCSACHTTDAPWHAPREAPNLSGAGIRLQTEWLRRYLANPRSVDPGTTMPNVMQHLDPAQREEAIEAIVAFLSTQQMPFATLKAGGALPVVHEFWNRGDPERGRTLYHTIGCVACHAPDDDYPVSDSAPSAIDALIEQLDPEELAEMGLSGLARRVESIPHGDLKSKYSRQSLTMFLLEPSRTRPCGRMPNMRLSPDEAADLTAHLMVESGTPIRPAEPSDPKRIERGRQWFEKLRCAQCHQAKGVTANRPSKSLTALDPTAESSCLDRPNGEMPRFALDTEQRNALRERLRSASKTQTPSAEVQSRLIQWNCVGCHTRSETTDQLALGGVGRFRKGYFETVGSVDLGDEGRLPPPLTGVEQKIPKPALAAVFAAKTPRYRPYMTIRMPAYHLETIQPLVQRLSNADGVDRRDPEAVFDVAKAYTKDQLLAAGRQLSDTGCVQCHLFAGESLPGVVGIDLQGIDQRVHAAWFAEFVRNPGAIKKRTRMPTFFPDGKSNSPDILGGNVNAQIAALWYYLSDVQASSLPEKIAEARSADYELKPADRPIILRTFMQDVGTHAIAVGFPNNVHYGWDSESCRLVLSWKGQFMDARSTWFERFAPPAPPLGESIVRLQTQPPVLASEKQQPSFQGYTLDPGGVPTMLYRVGRWQIRDRIEAKENVSLQRTVQVSREAKEDARVESDVPSALVWQVFAGEDLNSLKPLVMNNGQGVTVQVSSETELNDTLRQQDGVTIWSLQINSPTTFSVEYSW